MEEVEGDRKEGNGTRWKIYDLPPLRLPWVHFRSLPGTARTPILVPGFLSLVTRYVPLPPSPYSIDITCLSESSRKWILHVYKRALFWFSSNSSYLKLKEVFIAVKYTYIQLPS